MMCTNLGTHWPMRPLRSLHPWESNITLKTRKSSFPLWRTDSCCDDRWTGKRFWKKERQQKPETFYHLPLDGSIGPWERFISQHRRKPVKLGNFHTETITLELISITPGSHQSGETLHVEPRNSLLGYHGNSSCATWESDDLIGKKAHMRPFKAVWGLSATFKTHRNFEWSDWPDSTEYKLVQLLNCQVS